VRHEGYLALAGRRADPHHYFALYVCFPLRTASAYEGVAGDLEQVSRRCCVKGMLARSMCGY
jgi:hypothetical protein